MALYNQLSRHAQSDYKFKRTFVELFYSCQRCLYEASGQSSSIICMMFLHIWNLLQKFLVIVSFTDTDKAPRLLNIICETWKFLSSVPRWSVSRSERLLTILMI